MGTRSAARGPFPSAFRVAEVHRLPQRGGNAQVLLCRGGRLCQGIQLLVFSALCQRTMRWPVQIEWMSVAECTKERWQPEQQER